MSARPQKLRRLVAGGALTAATIAVATACSSSGGSPSAPPTSVGVTLPGVTAGATLPTSLPTVPTTLPSVSVPASLASELPTGVPTNLSSLLTNMPSITPSSTFCSVLKSAPSRAQMSNATNIRKYLGYFDKLEAAAPAQLKPDVKAVHDYLSGLASGHPHAIDPTTLARAFAVLTRAQTSCSKH
jgi:hypothetical protein